MFDLKLCVAVLAARTVAFLLKLSGRNGSHLPGAAALRICPDILERIPKPETVICVTGTNGKTTTSNLIASVLRISGVGVTNNNYGSNLLQGIVCALAVNSTVTGKPKKKVAVLEVDERSSLKIYPFLKPDYIVCTNIMQDSLLRNAHPEFIARIISDAVPAETKLILNDDDPVCVSLAPQCENRLYCSVDSSVATGAGHCGRMAVACPHCGAPLDYTCVRYENIGDWYCSCCKQSRPEPDYVISEVDLSSDTFVFHNRQFEDTLRLPNDNPVLLYDFCEAAAILTEVGIDTADLKSGFANATIVDNRYNSFFCGDHRITMILAKGMNVAAVNSVFRYVAAKQGDNKGVLLILDDSIYNHNDSENICWLYELDYSPLKDKTIRSLVFAGERYKDHILRAAMTGLELTDIKTSPSVPGSSDLLDKDKIRDIYILYGAYEIGLAECERDRLIKRCEANDI